MIEQFDVVIVGGGNAGFGVSAVVSEAGKSIAFIEERDFGGTCPNRGCTPKKILVAAAHTLHEIETASAHGISVGAPKLDWKKLIRREKNMIAAIPENMLSLAKKRGQVFRGTARFTSPDTVTVGDVSLRGENIVIATGSKPRPLPIPGAELMVTSDEVLSEEELPESVVFIGGGVIAMEFCHVYARAGTQVTILEALPQLLPRMDADAVAAIRKETERLGVIIETDVRVDAVSRNGGGMVVAYSVDGEEKSITCDQVVNGAGRIANVDGLDLKAGSVAHDGIRIMTDEYLRSSSNPRVWLAGDALVTSPQLSPVATYEGRIIGYNIVNSAMKKPDYSNLPSAVYTVPALASVGLSEQEAREQGYQVNVTNSDMSGWFSTRTYAETTAWSKVITDADSGKFLGAHIVGHHGEDLIHLFALAMRFGITAGQLKDSHFAFPTYSYDTKSMF